MTALAGEIVAGIAARGISDLGADQSKGSGDKITAIADRAAPVIVWQRISVGDYPLGLSSGGPRPWRWRRQRCGDRRRDSACNRIRAVLGWPNDQQGYSSDCHCA